MKKILFIALLPAVLFSCSGGENSSSAEKATFNTNEEKLSYAIGLDAGREIVNTLKRQQMDTILDRELMLKGMTDAIMENEPAFHPDSARMMITEYFMGMQERRMQEELKQFESVKEEGIKFLADNKARPEVKTTPSGLQFEVMRAASGAKPALNDSVLVDYKGYFINEKVFDSSYERGEPFGFRLNYGTVIEGWVEAVQLMEKGSQYKFYIPQELGYGERMLPGIPPYSVLIFEIELKGIFK